MTTSPRCTKLYRYRLVVKRNLRPAAMRIDALARPPSQRK